MYGFCRRTPSGVNCSLPLVGYILFPHPVCEDVKHLGSLKRVGVVGRSADVVSALKNREGCVCVEEGERSGKEALRGESGPGQNGVCEVLNTE